MLRISARRTRTEGGRATSSRLTTCRRNQVSNQCEDGVARPRQIFATSLEEMSWRKARQAGCRGYPAAGRGLSGRSLAPAQDIAHPRLGGAERFLFAPEAEIREEGYEARPLTSASRPPAQTHEPPVGVVRVDSGDAKPAGRRRHGAPSRRGGGASGWAMTTSGCRDCCRHSSSE